MTREINLIVIHCSATPSGKPIGTPAHNAAWVINSWHAARGFQREKAAIARYNPLLPSIGYHMVIDLDGNPLPGRSFSEVPAQAAGFNANAIGICLVGGAEREGRYTTAQWGALADIVRTLAEKYSVPVQPPVRANTTNVARWPTGFSVTGGVCGHRDLSPDKNGNGLIESFEWIKTCPGFDVSTWLSRSLVPEAKHVIEVTP